MTSRSALSSTWAEQRLAEVHRDAWGRLLSILISRTRRLDLAEDALAEAFARAAARWPPDGAPSNPEGWLYTTAQRLVVARLRAEALAGRKAPLLAMREDARGVPDLEDRLPDERLELILLCCHPALEPASRCALALRLVIGTSTAEIARLFLVPTATMAARLTRAKKKIVAAGIPLRMPAETELTDRLESVCRTIYLAFTVGYAPGSGPDLLRADLAGEALELARILGALVPADPTTRSLLALLGLQHARRDARVADGRLVPLAEQDRSRWQADEISAAAALLDTVAPTSGYPEVVRIEALIAREHAVAPNASLTDWRAIADLYRRLDELTGSPVVRLNRAVAEAEIDGPNAGLALLEGLDEALGDGHRLHAVRADLLRRAGRSAVAAASYRLAIERCANEVERSFLERRLLEVVDRGS